MIIKSMGAGNRLIPSILLAASAVIGILLAATGLLEPDISAGDVVAQVNQTVIKPETYQRIVDNLTAEKRVPLTTAERQMILDRLIDEELLVQRGVELGFLTLNSTVRNTLIQAVTTSVVTDSGTRIPSESELASFLASRADLFTRPARLHLRQIIFANHNGEVSPKAATAGQRLNEGGDFRQIEQKLGDPENPPLPDTLLPVAKVREYLGPTLLERALQMQIGTYSEPVEIQGRTIILQLVNRIDAITPPLTSIRREVEVEYQRSLAETALRDYLLWLRNRADISTRAMP